MERLSRVACFGALERGRPRCRAVASTSVVLQSNPTTRNPLHTARETGAIWSHPVLIAALEGKDYQSRVLCVVFFWFSLVAQELLRDALKRARSYYTLDWWAVTRRAPHTPSPDIFCALDALFVRGYEVCCIQTVIPVTSSLSRFFFFPSPPSYSHLSLSCSSECEDANSQLVLTQGLVLLIPPSIPTISVFWIFL